MSEVKYIKLKSALKELSPYEPFRIIIHDYISSITNLEYLNYASQYDKFKQFLDMYVVSSYTYTSDSDGKYTMFILEYPNVIDN